MRAKSIPIVLLTSFLAATASSAEPAKTIDELLAKAHRTVEGVRLELPVLGVTIYVPKNDLWIASASNDHGSDVLSAPSAALALMLVNVEYRRDYPTCEGWEAKQKDWLEKNPSSGAEMKEGGDWIPSGWHPRIYRGTRATACRDALGGVILVQAPLEEKDRAAVGHVFAGVGDQIDPINEAIAARPVTLSVLKVSFKNPAGSLWTATTIRLGPDGKYNAAAPERDTLERVSPRDPKIYAMLAWTPGAPVTCADGLTHMAQRPGGRTEDGGKLVPSTWTQKQAFAPGEVVVCTDRPDGLLVAHIVMPNPESVSDENAATVRGVLQSITDALDAKKAQPAGN
jgi:hypothetical protein